MSEMNFSVEGYRPRVTWIICAYLLCFLVFTDRMQFADGYCYELNVKNAEYQMSMEGNYYLVDNYLCNGLPIWLQASTVNGYYVASYYYIYYTYVVFNNTVGPTFGGWVIGPYMCPTGYISGLAVVAYNQQTVGTLPTNLPNSWYEYNGTNYVHNYNLEVNCDNSLDGWEIFGIVIGSICGFFLLISILACCCSKCKEKKRRTQNPTAVVYSAGVRGARAPVTVVTTTGPINQPSGTVPYTQPVYIINPPAYDNNLPPAYDSISAAGATGVVNDGFDKKF